MTMQRQLILLALHKELIKRATMTAHIIFFFMSLLESAKRHNPLQSYFPNPLPCRQPVVAPHPRDAAQLSEIVCENTTQYSRIMMTLLTSVPHKKTEDQNEKKKKKPHITTRTSSAGLNALNAPV